MVPTVGLCLVAYFCFHALQGHRSIFARERLEAELAQAHETLDTLQAERRHLEHRTDLLMPDGLDLDLLEERARSVLNYAHPDDVILFANPASPSRDPQGPDPAPRPAP
ncbi:MAG: septum formation initiator family protein [Alphaproteobacteria bacterium]|nr:septum formation initiator family protein [Alphaproteobacteria bacterium]